MHYETLDQVADEVKRIVDNYWKLEITAQSMESSVKCIFQHSSNRGLVMRGLRFKPAFVRKLGEKRIEELKRVLLKIDSELYSDLIL